MSGRYPTEDLIARLAKDVPPVRPVRMASVVLGLLGITFAIVAGITVGHFGCRPDLGRIVADPVFWLAELALLGIGITATYRATASALPARRPSTAAKIAFALALGLLMVAFGALFTRGGWQSEWTAGSDLHGIACTRVLTTLAMLPLIVLWLAWRRLAPTEPARTARWGLVAGGALAAAGLGCICDSPSALHLLFWHWLPIALAAALLGGLGRWLWRW